MIYIQLCFLFNLYMHLQVLPSTQARHMYALRRWKLFLWGELKSASLSCRIDLFLVFWDSVHDHRPKDKMLPWRGIKMLCLQGYDRHHGLTLFLYSFCLWLEFGLLMEVQSMLNAINLWHAYNERLDAIPFFFKAKFAHKHSKKIGDSCVNQTAPKIAI